MSHPIPKSTEDVIAGIRDEALELSAACERLLLSGKSYVHRSLNTRKDVSPSIATLRMLALEELIDAFGWLEAGVIGLSAPSALTALADSIESALSRHAVKCAKRNLPYLDLTGEFLLKLADLARSRAAEQGQRTVPSDEAIECLKMIVQRKLIDYRFRHMGLKRQIDEILLAVEVAGLNNVTRSRVARELALVRHVSIENLNNQ